VPIGEHQFLSDAAYNNDRGDEGGQIARYHQEGTDCGEISGASINWILAAVLGIQWTLGNSSEIQSLIE
jgi:hypothetical protein